MRRPKSVNERRITLLGVLRGLAGLAGRIGEGRIYPSVRDEVQAYLEGANRA